jgi:ketosteroid isomerase-like protein
LHDCRFDEKIPNFRWTKHNNANLLNRKPMTKIILFITFALTATINNNDVNNQNLEILKESPRNSELNNYWKELSRTVREGDFEGYKATYHEDAVVIFATGRNKVSNSLSTALAGWKQGFDDTKSGKVKSDVTFRFFQIIGDDTTAHQTGIFHYTSIASDGKVLANQLVHFEMLLVKKHGRWLGVMEYQKSMATQEEWDAMKKLD